jgi:hypothetical protein
VIGSAEFQAYQDVAGATAFLAGDVARAAPWGLLNDDARGRGLVSATRLMRGLPWAGAAPDPAADPEDLPPEVAEVCAMLACDLATRPRLFADASGDSNVKVAKAGSASVEFFAPVAGGPLIPAALWRLLLSAGLVAGTAAGAATRWPDDSPAGGVYAGGRGCRPEQGRRADYSREGYAAEDTD